MLKISRVGMRWFVNCDDKSIEKYIWKLSIFSWLASEKASLSSPLKFFEITISAIPSPHLWSEQMSRNPRGCFPTEKKVWNVEIYQFFVLKFTTFHLVTFNIFFSPLGRNFRGLFCKILRAKDRKINILILFLSSKWGMLLLFLFFFFLIKTSFYLKKIIVKRALFFFPCSTIFRNFSNWNEFWKS